MGSSYPTIVPYRVFPSQDRDFALAVGSEKLWSAFCKAIDRLDLEHHPDYANNSLRVRHRAAFEAILFDLFRQRPAQEWLAKLRAAGVPCSLVRNLREVVEDPQSAYRGMFPVIDHPTIGPHRVTGMPIKFSDTPGGGSLPAPLLGQHTRSALAELLDLDESTVADLSRRGVIFDSGPGAL
jgi:crotonobetainyl-CoA:carnitine CoA-transferase CaiB-like acyl-CoA transferase